MKKYKVILTAGLLLIAAALFLTGYSLWEARQAEKESRRALESILQASTPIAEALPAVPEAASSAPPQPDALPPADQELSSKEIDGVSYIGLFSIPAQKLQLPVQADWNYQKLQVSPCQYSGTPYARNFILCAHNYIAHFGGLKDLIPGDTVLFTDMDGGIFTYQVAEVSTLQPTDLEMLMEPWDLSLFTCTRGGSARLVVRCSLENYSAG